MVQLSVKTTGAELVRQGLQDLTAEIPKIGRKGIYDKMVEARTELRTAGKPISYPVRWASEKQRRYVIALLRSKGNLPYRRTGKHPSSWNIVKITEGYRFENEVDTAVHLYGNYEGARQSPIHEGRHPIFQKVIEEKVQELPPEIEQHITYYARSKGL